MSEVNPAAVVQIAIDDALKAASPFYESMARDHIPALQVAIFQALEANGLEIREKKKAEPAKA